jgi:hypothetical protein
VTEDNNSLQRQTIAVFYNSVSSHSHLRLLLFFFKIINIGAAHRWPVIHCLTASSCAKRFTETPIFHLFAVPFSCSCLCITNNTTIPKYPTKHSNPHRIQSRVLPLGRLKEDSIGIEVRSLKDLSFTQNIRQGSRNCETSFKPGASKSVVILQHDQAFSITLICS